MLGASKFSAADFTKLLSASDVLKSEKANAKGFVEVNVGASSGSQFTLDANRVRELTHVVQFLEKQEHDIKDAVEYRVVQDIAKEEQLAKENQAKIQGKVTVKTAKPKK